MKDIVGPHKYLNQVWETHAATAETEVSGVISSAFPLKISGFWWPNEEFTFYAYILNYIKDVIVFETLILKAFHRKITTFLISSPTLCGEGGVLNQHYGFDLNAI